MGSWGISIIAAVGRVAKQRHFLLTKAGKAGVVAMLVLCGPYARGVARTGGPAVAGEARRIASGLWGGDHVRMMVSDVGARLEYDCAGGTIDQPIVLDASGKFAAKGSYTPERGGPRRDGATAVARARYTGRVAGDTITLTVTLETSKERVGMFTLKRGDDVLLTKCR